jgi:purine-nucleoside phosphorylase
VLWFGYLNGVPVVMMQGRVHLYEGWSVNEVVFLTRLMMFLGAKIFMPTHAVGAVTKNLEPKDIVGVRSHIALECPDPTAGVDALELGTEFTPMGGAYSERLLALAKECALEEKASFHRGVSYFKQGRTYEAEAEVGCMPRAGADVATMSTIPEVIAAVHMGAEVLDLALVTNMGCGLGSSMPLSHTEVQSVAELMKDKFGSLVRRIIGSISIAEKWPFALDPR